MNQQQKNGKGCWTCNTEDLFTGGSKNYENPIGNEGASFRILYSMHTGPNRKEKKNYIAKNTWEILREMEWIWRHYIFWCKRNELIERVVGKEGSNDGGYADEKWRK